MPHDHAPDIPTRTGRLALVVGLNLAITVAEVIGGILSGSLSLISDALHNFSDGVAVIIAWIAIRLETRPRTDRHTFGFKRAQVLAAVINAGALVAISVFLFVEAWHRLVDPRPIQGLIMTMVAGVGLIANILGTWLLHRDSKQNMNLRAAYLHLFSDAISSVGVILGGIAIAGWGISWLDPLLTVLIGLYVLKESLHILWDALGIFLLRAPRNIILKEVRAAILDVEGVADIHHVHLWELAEHDIQFEAHIQVEDQPLSSAGKIRERIEQMLARRFHIHHATLQIEARGEPCATANLA
jgi:cobalt-zinc-cadmium efflux system protein